MYSLRTFTAICLAFALALAAAPAVAQPAAELADGLATAPLPADDTPPATEAVPATAEELIPVASFFDVMRAGGLLMWPLLLCSLITMAFLFERLISLRRHRVIPGPFVRRFLHQLQDGQLDRQEALDLCEDNRSPVAQVFASAVRKWGKPAVEVEQAVLDAGERAVNGLRKYVRIFNAVSTVAPLLGLLGTVTGMIQAFNDISTSNAMGRPELLAKGMGEALLTTAAGLAVAIPALIFYLYFISRVDQLVVEIDALGQEVVAAISTEGLAENPRPTKGARTRRQDSAA